MKILKLSIIILLFYSFNVIGQDEKPSLLKSFKFSVLSFTELGGQWKPTVREEDKWPNIPHEDMDPKDIPHTYFSYGLDLQLNYMIDDAGLLGIGYQNQHFTDNNMLGNLNTYYLHFRTGDDFDSKFCLYVEFDLGASTMNNEFKGIMYRITGGVDFNGLNIPYVTPSVNIYIGQRPLSYISSHQYSGGFYNMFGIGLGLRING
ncbi:hypothetical protein [Flammeovirga pacifica]|uniref:Outer membrane protein beta-barrel domain-containing protein n=1 Tax=Flammeovirga pacifica TaxID=915059 RepID=A0A1S1Z0D8_FLAPC|nr:hypothetical protein [Flammeovirga pacifica]OHX66565.1 hypothetical protein NH26_09435 [Flammeovirga pacifica]